MFLEQEDKVMTKCNNDDVRKFAEEKKERKRERERKREKERERERQRERQRKEDLYDIPSYKNKQKKNLYFFFSFGDEGCKEGDYCNRENTHFTHSLNTLFMPQKNSNSIPTTRKRILFEKIKYMYFTNRKLVNHRETPSHSRF